MIGDKSLAILTEGCLISEHIPLPQEFVSAVEEACFLHSDKCRDYGDEDPYANVVATAESIGIEPWIGAHMRMGDKRRRLDKFARGESLNNESARDSMIDNVVYSIIRLILFDRSQDAKS